MKRLVILLNYGLTFSVNVSAESPIGHHMLGGWVTMVFPVGGYVLCVYEKNDKVNTLHFPLL